MIETRQLLIRAPGRLCERLKAEARRRGVSLNRHCLDRLGSVQGVSDSAVAALVDSELGEDLDGVVLFGSVARGEEHDGSDTDWLLVVRAGVRVERNLYTRWDRLSLDERIAPQFVGWPERLGMAGSLWLEAALDGIVLWERERRVSGFLVRLRRWMWEGRVERKTTYGVSYWVKSHAKHGTG